VPPKVAVVEAFVTTMLLLGSTKRTEHSGKGWQLTEAGEESSGGASMLSGLVSLVGNIRFGTSKAQEPTGFRSRCPLGKCVVPDVTT
jgi:hypothetical protein